MTSSTSATGAILGRRYELLRKLGAGGMGEVYEARRIDLGDRVAVKLLREEDREDPELRERFLREARTLAQVASPHVVRIVDFMALPGEVAFLVMELIVGQSVAELLRTRGPFSPRELGPIAMQMFAGLGAIHAVGLVHRDIKPQNLMIVDGGPLGPILKIVDFGLAKATASGERPITHHAGMLGTPAYMAPEQVGGNATIDARADVYGAAATFLVLATGKKLYDDRSEPMIAAMLAGRRLPVAQVAPELGPALCGTLERALSTDRNLRHARIEDLSADIARDLATLSNSGPPTAFGAAVPTFEASSISPPNTAYDGSVRGPGSHATNATNATNATGVPPTVSGGPSMAGSFSRAPSVPPTMAQQVPPTMAHGPSYGAPNAYGPSGHSGPTLASSPPSHAPNQGPPMGHVPQVPFGPIPSGLAEPKKSWPLVLAGVGALFGLIGVLAIVGLFVWRPSATPIPTPTSSAGPSAASTPVSTGALSPTEPTTLTSGRKPPKSSQGPISPSIPTVPLSVPTAPALPTAPPPGSAPPPVLGPDPTRTTTRCTADAQCASRSFCDTSIGYCTCSRAGGYNHPSIFCGGDCVVQDNSHCGGCATVCGANETCADPVNGTWLMKCANCPSRFPHAGICNGGCTNLDNNAQNCGRCGNNCMADPTCRAGGKSCSCQAGKCVSR